MYYVLLFIKNYCGNNLEVGIVDRVSVGKNAIFKKMICLLFVVFF